LLYKEQIDDWATAHRSPLTAHLFSAFRPLSSAFGTFANSADSFANARSIAVTFADAAAKPSSMGRGDFVSRVAV